MTAYSYTRVERFAKELAEAYGVSWAGLAAVMHHADWMDVAERAITYGAVPPADPVEEKAEELYNVFWSSTDGIILGVGWNETVGAHRERFLKLAKHVMKGS